MVAKLNPLLLLVVLVSLQGWWCHGCWEEERFALLQIRSSFPVDVSSDILKSWIEGKSYCCRWEGVVCNNTTGRVTKLDLQPWGDWTHNCYLNASYLLALEDLESLSVRYSCLAGFVMDEGLGRRLSRMSKLMLLDLSNNNLADTDNIFQFLSGLPSLRVLDLAYNSLTGSIHYAGLDTLSSRLSKLEVIDLSYNDLNDNIFLHLSWFLSLKSLNLTQNQLMGSISQGFEGQSLKLSKLMFLDLSGNNLNDSKTTFQYLSGLSSLKHLNLRDNQLRRPILSMEMHNLRNLEDLILDDNPLEKSFVQSLGALSNSLKFLSLSSGLHDLKNFLGEGICELKKLEELDLSWNELQGMIPSCLTNMTSLKLLDLSNNFFTGNIALSPLPRLTSLVYLSISNNSFQVPASFNSFANNSNLEFILADDNELVSDTDSLQTLPPKFQLKVFTLSNRRLGQLNVTLPSFLCHQYDLRVIDLSCINFGGNIPSWLLESNRRLELVFLRNNSFVGSFHLPSHPWPETRILDLRNNNLQGHIPANINLTFPNLEMLTLVFNDLDGKIPESLSYMTHLFF